jgi:hypothetical protein
MRRLGLIMAGAVAIAAFGAGWAAQSWKLARTPVERVRHSGLWKPLLSADRSILLTVGDYYMFGEKDQGSDEVRRLVREFKVQSPQDLQRWIALDPSREGRYVDVSLSYLPVGAAEAMHAIVPIVTNERVDGRRLLTAPASELNVHLVSRNDIVYVGYISGLADLRWPVFGGSRFKVGQSYDELIDSKTGKHYVADSHLSLRDLPGQDYAIVSSLQGPMGNRIIVIAGTRDAALMQAARFVTDPATVQSLDKLAAQSGSYEALIGVDVLENVGLRARLIVASARPAPSWSAPTSVRFPDQLPAAIER